MIEESIHIIAKWLAENYSHSIEEAIELAGKLKEVLEDSNYYITYDASWDI